MATTLQNLLISLLASLTALVQLLNLGGLPTATLNYPSETSGALTRLTVELARTPAEQAQGLSGRASLPADRGMLFVFPADTRPSFWMKNMNFSLDFLWLDSGGTIVQIDRDISPATYPQSFTPAAPVRYVLEVNAGYAARHELETGDTIFNLP